MPPSRLPASVLAALGLATVAACDGGDDTATGPCLSAIIDSGDSGDSDDSGQEPEDSGSNSVPSLDPDAARSRLDEAGIVPAERSTPSKEL